MRRSFVAATLLMLVACNKDLSHERTAWERLWAQEKVLSLRQQECDARVRFAAVTAQRNAAEESCTAARIQLRDEALEPLRRRGLIGPDAYVAAMGSGLRIINIANPAAPVQAGFYDTPGDAWSVAAAGSYAYVADGFSGLRIVNVAHAGDGNVHPILLFDERDPDQVARVLAAGHDLLEECIACGGSVTAEHGVGVEKLAFMERLFAPADLEAMRRVHRVMNPTGRLNPGKLLPPQPN